MKKRKKRNLVAIDTGAMYRCITLDCLNNGVEPTDIEGINRILHKINIELKVENGEQKFYLNGEDVSSQIRTKKIDDYVSLFAAIKEVRDKVTPMQQKMGDNQNIIMEGRDIGTVVFPNADVKIFLECSAEERARRRFIQNQKEGIQTTYEEILYNVIERERINSTRDVAPFIKADDAIVVDSTNMSIDEVVEACLKIIDEKLEK